MKTLLWIALFAGARCFAISLTLTWKYMVMSNEYKSNQKETPAEDRGWGLLIKP